MLLLPQKPAKTYVYTWYQFFFHIVFTTKYGSLIKIIIKLYIIPSAGHFNLSILPAGLAIMGFILPGLVKYGADSGTSELIITGSPGMPKKEMDYTLKNK